MAKPARSAPVRTTSLALVVSATPDAPATARRSLDRLSEIDPHTRETLTLLISELVTNAVRHAGRTALDRIHVAISTEPVVRVEVTDGGPGFDPAAVRRAHTDGGGWGLLIVDRLAARWGVDPAALVRVWFELS